MTHTVEAGATLQVVHAEVGGVQGVFSSKVVDYVASRPDYPRALVTRLVEATRLPSGARGCAVDMGCGTGLLTRDLLPHFDVLAVDPNDPMRAACDAWLGGRPGYRSAHGSAESIPAADKSVDLITAATAFHWFEIPRARAEALRVLKPGAPVALIWNDRVRSDPFQQAMDAVFEEFGGPKRDALLAHENRARMAEFFGLAQPPVESWPHQHWIDEAALASLALSRSYMPARGTPECDAAIARLHHVFADHAQGDRVCVRYDCVASISPIC